MREVCKLNWHLNCFKFCVFSLIFTKYAEETELQLYTYTVNKDGL